LFSHKPVLSVELLKFLGVKPGKIYFDGTLGGAGHSRLILDLLGDSGHLYSFDQDETVIKALSEESKTRKNWTLVHANFSTIPDFCLANKITIDGGIFLDLGLSSIQLDDPERGFGFQNDSLLDMRMDKSRDFSAYDLINKFSENEIADILYKFGDERKSRQIARAIINKRPIETTQELSELIKKVYLRSFSRSSNPSKKSFKIHPATKSFQAIRVFINDELDSLASILDGARAVMEQSARFVVISFQSQEDRIVKNYFKKMGKVLSKKPLQATQEELLSNPRARSAKLRALEIE
jgi:16S rRNA (cytosine1402-N4)-methyltransferase